MSEIEVLIRESRGDLDRWLASSYEGREELKYYGENDASYPQWATIEKVVGSIFDNQSGQQLGKDCQEAILFFISRSDEIGCIIRWLSTEPGSPLSGCGRLTESDFLFLCEKSLELPEDYSDFQLASCFEKFTVLKPEYERVLLRFFNRNGSYTRRRSLHSLARLAYPGIIDLAAKLWASDDCEFAKLSCLYTLKEAAGGKQLFEKFLVEFESTYDVANSAYLPGHVERLKAS
jgi:hypothetical protein